LRALRYLTSEDVIYACRRAIEEHGGGPFGLISRHNLDFVMEFVADYGRDVFEKAAFLMYNIALSHPFLNGNKRTAFIVTYAFLRTNGWRLRCGSGEGLSFMLELASGRKSMDEVREWIKEHVERASSEQDVRSLIEEALREHRELLRRLAKR